MRRLFFMGKRKLDGWIDRWTSVHKDKIIGKFKSEGKNMSVKDVTCKIVANWYMRTNSHGVTSRNNTIWRFMLRTSLEWFYDQGNYFTGPFGIYFITLRVAASWGDKTNQYIYIYIRMHKHVHLDLHFYLRLHSMYINTYIYMYTYICIHKHVHLGHMYVYINILCVHMYIYIYICIYILWSFSTSS